MRHAPDPPPQLPRAHVSQDVVTNYLGAPGESQSAPPSAHGPTRVRFAGLPTPTLAGQAARRAASPACGCPRVLPFSPTGGLRSLARQVQEPGRTSPSTVHTQTLPSTWVATSVAVASASVAGGGDSGPPADPHPRREAQSGAGPEGRSRLGHGTSRCRREEAVPPRHQSPHG